MSQRTHFTPELKREAVQCLEIGSRPAAEMAQELGVRRNQLYNKWQRAPRLPTVLWAEKFPSAVSSRSNLSRVWSARSFQPRVLPFQFLQPFCLIDFQSAILVPPAIAGLFGDA